MAILPSAHKYTLTLFAAIAIISFGLLEAAPGSESRPLWRGDFQQGWEEAWQVSSHGRFGWQNISTLSDPGMPGAKVLRVRYPAGSASPTVTRNEKAPVGGAQFYAPVFKAPRDKVRLQYFVRFAPGFEFVKGGKLPGLYGGTVMNGKRIPNGANGFSTRFMWRKNGAGEVYAYLPTSVAHGTSLGRGNWRFTPGRWHRLEQIVTLNTPGQRDGRLQVRVDGKPVLDEQGLLFRTTAALKIEGIFFSTFFGGDDPTWASPKTTYADFARFTLDDASSSR
jgi:hypothetical protein